MSPATRYHRYEPVQPPDIVLRDALDGPGDSTRVIVIRSEDANDNAFKETFRHALPPRNSVQLAEHHGFLDSSPGVPDPALYPVIAAHDAENLATHPAGVPVDPSDPSGERIFPINHMVLNYLADPLAQQALVRGLPPTGAGTEALLPFRTNAYPDWDTFTIRLLSAASGWNVAGPVLDVALDKAWDIDVRVSCVFDDDHLNNDELGVWPWIQAWVAATWWTVHRRAAPEPHPPGQALDVHTQPAPAARARGTHAARSARRHPARRAATRRRAHVRAHVAPDRHPPAQHRARRPVRQVVDEDRHRPRAATTRPLPHDFEATAFSVDVDHRSGEPETIDFEGDHEFGDMKHRFVDYQLVATTPFLEFYKESTTVMIPALPADDGRDRPGGRNRNRRRARRDCRPAGRVPARRGLHRRRDRAPDAAAGIADPAPGAGRGFVRRARDPQHVRRVSDEHLQLGPADRSERSSTSCRRSHGRATARAHRACAKGTCSASTCSGRGGRRATTSSSRSSCGGRRASSRSTRPSA